MLIRLGSIPQKPAGDRHIPYHTMAGDVRCRPIHGAPTAATDFAARVNCAQPAASRSRALCAQDPHLQAWQPGEFIEARERRWHFCHLKFFDERCGHSFSEPRAHVGN